MPIVKCSVSNCTYWAQGNNCNADMIMVEVDRHSRARLSEEFADEYRHSDDHKDAADDSAETCCHTFKKKEASA
ncbi:MAG: DUF1540 domain-containing protein [Brevibacillus sp.]|nr:DUF1540 domain-containing protein [Brevibacillus sp.]